MMVPFWAPPKERTIKQPNDNVISTVRQLAIPPTQSSIGLFTDNIDPLPLVTTPPQNCHMCCWRFCGCGQLNPEKLKQSRNTIHGTHHGQMIVPRLALSCGPAWLFHLKIITTFSHLFFMLARAPPVQHQHRKTSTLNVNLTVPDSTTANVPQLVFFTETDAFCISQLRSWRAFQQLDPLIC